MAGRIMLTFGSALLVFIADHVVFAADNVGMDPEVFMNTTQLITSKGYPCEEYDVHTHDGYILGVQRIPSGINNTSDQSRPVVLLLHGLLSSSAAWVENLNNESFAFLLADAGFDVWLANSRGNTYAKRHVTLKPDQKEFWYFTWDDMAKYDLPATVDKILNITQVAQLFFVGYSQGGAIGLAQLSNDPDLNSKIKLFAALAPSAYMSNTKSPIKAVAPYSKDMSFMMNLFGHGQFLPHSKFVTWLSSIGCKDIPSDLCSNMLFLLCGYDYTYMNKSRIPVYTGQNPAGTSARNMVQYLQGIENGKFGMFDFGPEENMKKYNKSTPPEYNITKVTVPIALYSGGSDIMITQPDNNRVKAQIKNLVLSKVVDKWEHLDFVWAMNSPQAVYNELIAMFKSHAGF